MENKGQTENEQDTHYLPATVLMEAAEVEPASASATARGALHALAASSLTVNLRRAGMNYGCDRLTLKPQAPIRSAGDPVQATLQSGQRKSWQER